jgi:hypothetical protein
VRKVSAARAAYKYRVRRQSLSILMPSKRRKLAFTKLSLPTARPLLLAATYALNKLYRSHDYVPHRGWHLPEIAIECRS